MNILYGGDAGVGEGICLSALSLCRHTAQALHIYILTASGGAREAIPPHFADRLQRAMRVHHSDHTVTLLDITEEFGAYLPLANMGTRFTPLCMLRLFADRVQEIPDRVLYLDADVMCCGDFASLYETDIDGVDIAGVPDRYGRWFFGRVWRHDYLNSGVLMLNMARIRQDGLFARCRTRCRYRRMFMPDQTALNKLAVKQKVSRRYNEQGAMRADTVFKHFTTFFRFFPYFHAVTVKPWDVERMHNELGITAFDDIIEEYQRSDVYV